jgi:hypothetical protein
MAFLNFTGRSIQIEKLAHPVYKTHLQISVAATERTEIVAQLRELTEKTGSELRVDFPGEVTFFWKLRDEESRLLLAHPEKDVWVATLALTPPHLDHLLTAMDQLDAPIFLSEFKRLGKLSNLEVSFRVLP